VSSTPPAGPSWASAPVGHDGTEAWLQAIGNATNVPQAQIDAAKNQWLPAIKGALARTPIKGRVTVSGYEGSELLVARLLIESGADVPYVGTACPKTPWSAPDLEWLEARGVRVQYRASLEQDIGGVREFRPDLAIGTTPVVQAAKQAAIPALYFTNLISARPLMGPGRRLAGPGDQRRHRQQGALRPDARFFGDVGGGDQPASGRTYLRLTRSSAPTRAAR
jgi:chlorophyllide a reductase subunit Y